MQEAVNMERRLLPAMRNFSHDGWLCTFTVQQQQEDPSAHSRATPTRANGMAGGTVRPSQ
jgi:hypothetical protein